MPLGVVLLVAAVAYARNKKPGCERKRDFAGGRLCCECVFFFLIQLFIIIFQKILAASVMLVA